MCFSSIKTETESSPGESSDPSSEPPEKPPCRRGRSCKNDFLGLSIINNYSDVAQIHFAGNPLHCDCSAMWLREWKLQSSRQDQQINLPICAHPANLRGAHLDQVDPVQLGCARQQVAVRYRTEGFPKHHILALTTLEHSISVTWKVEEKSEFSFPISIVFSLYPDLDVRKQLVSTLRNRKCFCTSQKSMSLVLLGI